MALGDDWGWGAVKDEARKMYDAFRDSPMDAGASRHRKLIIPRAFHPIPISSVFPATIPHYLSTETPVREGGYEGTTGAISQNIERPYLAAAHKALTRVGSAQSQLRRTRANPFPPWVPNDLETISAPGRPPDLQSAILNE